MLTGSTLGETAVPNWWALLVVPDAEFDLSRSVAVDFGTVWLAREESSVAVALGLSLARAPPAAVLATTLSLETECRLCAGACIFKGIALGFRRSKMPVVDAAFEAG